MSWRPPFATALEARDSRLDRYRERGALLWKRDDEVANVYIQIRVHWTQTGGHLWWRRWSAPYEIPHGFMILADRSLDDWLVRPEELEQEIVDWSANRLRYRGETLQVTWLDDDASLRLRTELGLEPA